MHHTSNTENPFLWYWSFCGIMFYLPYGSCVFRSQSVLWVGQLQGFFSPCSKYHSLISEIYNRPHWPLLWFVIVLCYINALQLSSCLWWVLELSWYTGCSTAVVLNLFSDSRTGKSPVDFPRTGTLSTRISSNPIIPCTCKHWYL